MPSSKPGKLPLTLDIEQSAKVRAIVQSYLDAALLMAWEEFPDSKPWWKNHDG